MSSLYRSLTDSKKRRIIARIVQSTGWDAVEVDEMLSGNAAKVRFHYSSNTWSLYLSEIVIMGTDNKLWETEDFSG